MTSTSRARRALISVVVLVVLAAIAFGNIGGQGIFGTLNRITQPIRTATGLQQNWLVFAPPRTMSAYVIARVDDADGTSSDFAIPADKGLGAYVDYRWHKYEEAIRVDDGSRYWPAYADYIAGRARAEGRHPIRVTLIRRWSDTMPPGPGPERGPWREYPIYVRDLR
jgi:hypothetical protein